MSMEMSEVERQAEELGLDVDELLALFAEWDDDRRVREGDPELMREEAAADAAALLAEAEAVLRRAKMVWKGMPSADAAAVVLGAEELRA